MTNDPVMAKTVTSFDAIKRRFSFGRRFSATLWNCRSHCQHRYRRRRKYFLRGLLFQPKPHVCFCNQKIHFCRFCFCRQRLRTIWRKTRGETKGRDLALLVLMKNSSRFFLKSENRKKCELLLSLSLSRVPMVEE